MIDKTNRPLLYTLLAAMVSGCSGSNVSNEPEASSTGSSTSIPTLSDPIGEGLMGPLGGSGIDGEYAQFNDSPFASISFNQGYFYLEDFEDNLLNHPGAAASAGGFVSLKFGPGFHDSVDADDGQIDGNSLDGESWFYESSRTGVVWSFDAEELDGRLPTHVGIVWTDGRSKITFEAFDAQGQSLGITVGQHYDASFNGETRDDRFYGAVNYAGISSIKISNDDRLNGIELDHLQWGYLPEASRLQP